MSERVTIGDLRRLVELINKYGGHLLEGEPNEWGSPRFELEEGSATYGRGWRIYATGGSKYNTGHYDPFRMSSGYLGWSKREAYQTLRGLVAGLSERQPA